MSKKGDLYDVQRALVKALTQHTSYAYRASSAVANQINAEVDKLAKVFIAGLSETLDDLTQSEIKAFTAGKYTTKRLKKLKADIEEFREGMRKHINDVWGETAKAQAAYELKYAADLMGGAVKGVGKVASSGAAVYALAMETPVMGEFVADMLDGLPDRQSKRVYAALREGLTSGLANSQIIRTIRGTAAMNYKDGIMQAARHEIDRIVRTARNHVGNVAHEVAYRDLGVAYVIRVAALEGRTCKACGALDGKRYQIDEPKPPATLHPNCRCQYAPSLEGGMIGNRPFVRAMKVQARDGTMEYRSIGRMTANQREAAGLKVGQVDANTTFATWFNRQDASYQHEWLGAKRYALYTKGEYSLDRFIDPMGKQYTLEELRILDKETFRRVFGE